MTDRERFEAWLVGRESEEAIQKDAQGVYGYWDTRQSWDAWQASRKQALEDAAVKIETTWAGTSHDLVCRVFAGIVRSVAHPEGEQG